MHTHFLISNQNEFTKKNHILHGLVFWGQMSRGQALKVFYVPICPSQQHHAGHSEAQVTPHLKVISPISFNFQDRSQLLQDEK